MAHDNCTTLAVKPKLLIFLFHDHLNIKDPVKSKNKFSKFLYTREIVDTNHLVDILSKNEYC